MSPPGHRDGGQDPQTWAPEEDVPGAGASAARSGAQRFELLTLLGRGGMGEVWRARDLDLGRIVAMKVLRPEVATRLAGRFLNEARATAALEHPGIVPIYEVGRLGDGRPYYTMQEIRGTTLRQRIRGVHEASGEGPFRPCPEGWTLRRLVEAFHQANEAVALAHVRGIIHRDLKPDNVMLGDYGEVRVVDWGLVKQVGDSSEDGAAFPSSGSEATGGTLHGQAAGTVGYMPPEQLEGQLDRLGPPSDVYALGGILHCILTGRGPARDGPLMELLSLARVPPDLRLLCLRAMSPAMDDRPRHAGVLAGQVRAWLDQTAERAQRDAAIDHADQAFIALPPQTRARAREVLLSLVDADCAALPRLLIELDVDATAILVGIGILALNEDRVDLASPALSEWPRLRAWVMADQEGQRIRRELGVASAGWSRRGRTAGDLWRGDLLDRALRWREQRLPRLTEAEVEFLEASAGQQGRRRSLRQLLVGGIGLGLVLATALSTTLWRQAEEARVAEGFALRAAEGRALAAEAARQRAAGREHAALVLDLARADLEPKRPSAEAGAAGPGDAWTSGTLFERPIVRPGPPRWSADGSSVAVLGGDGRLWVQDRAGRTLLRMDEIARFAWAPTGRELAVLQVDGTLRVGPVGDLQARGTFPDGFLAWPDLIVIADAMQVLALDAEGGVRESWSRVGRMDATLSADGRHESWVDGVWHVRDIALGTEVELALAQQAAIFGYRPDLERFWVGDHVGDLRIFDREGALVAQSRGRGPGLSSAALSPKGRRLVIGGYDNRVRVLSLQDGEALVDFEGHDRPVHALAFHPSGEQIASGGGDDEVLVWEAASGRIIARLAGMVGGVTGLEFSPDGRTLAVSTAGALLTWSPSALPLRNLVRCPGGRAEIDATGAHLFTLGREPGCVTDVADGQRWEIPGLRDVEPGSPGQEPLALVGGRLVRLDLEGGQLRPLAELPGARSIHDPGTGELSWVSEEGVLSGGRPGAGWASEMVDWPGWHRHSAGSPFLTYMDSSGRLVVMDLRDGSRPLVLSADQVSPLNIGWVVDGTRLLVGDPGGVVRAWDLDRPARDPEILDLGHGAPVSALTAGPGRTAVADGDGHVRVVAGSDEVLELQLDGHASPTSLAFSPDGQRLLVGIDHAAFEVFDLGQGGRRVLVVDRGRRGLLHTLGWTTDGEVIGVGTDDAWTWPLPPEGGEPLALSNLRVCRGDVRVVPVAEPDLRSPWAPAADCP